MGSSLTDHVLCTSKRLELIYHLNKEHNAIRLNSINRKLSFRSVCITKYLFFAECLVRFTEILCLSISRVCSYFDLFFYMTIQNGNFTGILYFEKIYNFVLFLIKSLGMFKGFYEIVHWKLDMHGPSL